VLYNVELKEVVSDDTGVMGAQVFSHETGTTTLMPIDGIFLAIGHQPNTALFQNKLVLDKEGFIKVHERTQKTSMPGVFAAGDVEDKVYRQAGVAAASGIKAALDADAFLAEQGVTPQLLKSHGEQLYCAQARQKRQNIPYLVSQQELDEYTAQVHDSLVVVLFVTQGCSVCTQMIPMVNELASELEGIAFAFVDANKAESLVQAHFVHKVPCVMAFSDNRLLGRYNGGMTKKELTHFIESLAR
jgi:thioredoxin reductase (NADPH)